MAAPWGCGVRSWSVGCSKHHSAGAESPWGLVLATSSGPDGWPGSGAGVGGPHPSEDRPRSCSPGLLTRRTVFGQGPWAQLRENTPACARGLWSWIHPRARGSRRCGLGHGEQLGCGLVATVFWPVMLVFTIHIFNNLMLYLALDPFCRA